VQGRVQALAATFANKGYDAVTATQQSYGQIKDIVRRDAYIMAFDDAFLIVGISLTEYSSKDISAEYAHVGQKQPPARLDKKAGAA
jgi:hypothetical protein